MAYAPAAQPSATPYYPQSPIAVGPVALPSTAKTVFTDTSNAVQILAAMANNTQEVDSLYAEVVATLSAGKLLAFLYNGTTAWQVADIAHAAQTISTTAGVTPITFLSSNGSPFSASNPLIVPPGYSLWLASAVAQPAGALNGFGWGKVY